MAISNSSNYVRINHLTENKVSVNFTIRFYNSRDDFLESISENRKAKAYFNDEISFKLDNPKLDEPLRSQCYEYLKQNGFSDYQDC